MPLLRLRGCSSMRIHGLFRGGPYDGRLESWTSPVAADTIKVAQGYDESRQPSAKVPVDKYRLIEDDYAPTGIPGHRFAAFEWYQAADSAASLVHVWVE